VRVSTLFALYGTGKFHVQYEQVLGRSSFAFLRPQPLLSQLATGKLELEIKSDTEKK
jgi:hypothetical protein